MAWQEGDTGYEVEWIRRLGLVDPDDPSQGYDPDSNEVVCRNFRNHESAMEYVRTVFPKAASGYVEITPFVLRRQWDEDRFDPEFNVTKEYTEDTEVYEGEESEVG